MTGEELVAQEGLVFGRGATLVGESTIETGHGPLLTVVYVLDPTNKSRGVRMVETRFAVCPPGRKDASVSGVVKATFEDA